MYLCSEKVEEPLDYIFYLVKNLKCIDEKRMFVIITFNITLHFIRNHIHNMMAFGINPRPKAKEIINS